MEKFASEHWSFVGNTAKHNTVRKKSEMLMSKSEGNPKHEDRNEKKNIVCHFELGNS
jgi:hypothetical protein